MDLLGQNIVVQSRREKRREEKREGNAFPKELNLTLE